jgi:hypothetical protein
VGRIALDPGFQWVRDVNNATGHGSLALVNGVETQAEDTTKVAGVVRWRFRIILLKHDHTRVTFSMQS